MKVPAEFKRDPRLKTLEQLILKNKIEDYQEEVNKIHSSRVARFLLPNCSLLDLQKAAISDSSYRSRLVELLITSRSFSAILSSYLDKMDSYLLFKYPTLFEGLRFKNDREMVVSKLLAKYRLVLDKANLLEENIEWVVEDIDKKGYTLKLMLESIELATKREYVS